MVTLTCVGVNMSFIAMAYFLRNLGTTTLFGILLLASFVFIGIIYYSRPKSKTALKENMPKVGIIKSHKILSLASESIETE